MTAWTKQKLNDCVNLISGFPFKSARFTNNPEDIYLVKGENIGQSRILWEISKKWPADEWDKYEKYQLEVDDVVLAMDRPWVPSGLKWSTIGKDAPKSLLVQRCARLRAKNKMLYQIFLRYLIGGIQFEDYIKPITTGVNVPHISGKQILDFEVMLPSLQIQEKISDLLTNYDELIISNEKRIKILEEMAQRLYTEWFVKFKFPGHEKVKMVASGSEFGMIPEGWGIKTIQEICSKITDGSHWSPITKNIGYPMASVKDMNNWGFNIDECRKIAKSDFDKLVLSDCKPQKGDVLIAKDGSYLKHVFVVSKDTDLVILSSIAILRPTNIISAEYLRLCLLDSNTKSKMKNYVSGSALPRIILNNFRKFSILIPPILLLEEFNNTIMNSINLRNELLESNTSLKKIRDLLIPQLITGKREVKN